MLEVHVNSLAYCKMVLHLAKYPHLACNGILLAKKSRGNNSVVEIVDCVPLFHSSLTLAPPFEIAMNHIDAYAQLKGLEIVGEYHATENLSDNQPNNVTQKMAIKLKEQSRLTLVFMVNNQKLNPLNNQACYKVYQYDNKLDEINCKNIVEETAFETCSRLLNDKIYHALNDFDNHLDDISLDWRNQELNKLIPTGSNEAVDTLGN